MDKASVTFDTKEFFARLKLADAVTRKAAVKGMKDNTLDLERKGGELVPVDEGILLGSASSGVDEKGKDIEGHVSYNTPYAIAVHERMSPAAAPSLGSKMEPGPRTRAKPGNEFGPAGGWYLRRPLIGKATAYWNHLATTIKRALDSQGKAKS